MVIVIGISVAIFAVMSELFVQTQKIFHLEANKSHLELSSEAALARMNQTVRQSVGIVTSQGSYTTSGSTIIVKLATFDTSGTFVPLTYDYMIFRLDPTDTTKLQEITVADASSRRTNQTRTIASNIAGLSLNYYDSAGAVLAVSGVDATKKVKINMISTETSSKETATINHTEQVTLRNK
jgi:hypothetical protein